MFGENGEGDEFDFEAFCGIKEESLESANAMGGISDDLM